MKVPILGFMTFGDPVFRRDVRPDEFINTERNKMLNALQRVGLNVISVPEIVHSKSDAINQAKKLVQSGAESMIMYIPSWTLPSFVVIAVRSADKPCALLTQQPVPRSSGFVGFLAAGGSLDQLGIYHKRIVGDANNEKTIREMCVFARAASAVSRLKGQTFCVFGGRSFGMYTATADPIQWQIKFGVDVEHIDQAEIIWRAEKIPQERVNKFIKWLKESCGLIEFDGNILTEEKLERQVRCYLATKDLVSEHGLDFVGIKCQPELSTNYVTQCLTPAFLSDPYDGEGPKEPIVCACEADYDGALTMQILKLISGKPVLFMDVRCIDEEGGIFTNCGGMSTWYAECSDDPKQNLGKVHIRPQIQGLAGGAATQFVVTAGQITLARLLRREGRYWMAILKGETYQVSREKLKEVKWSWPHAFVNMRIDPEVFTREYGSNHIHAVAGDYVGELVEVCRIAEIEARRL